MSDLFNTIPENVNRYFYIFADLDALSDAAFVPVYEMNIKLEYSDLDIIEDCFTNKVVLNHVADMLVSTEITGNLFTYLNASVNAKVLSLTTIIIFLKQNGKIQVPYDLRKSTGRTSA